MDPELVRSQTIPVRMIFPNADLAKIQPLASNGRGVTIRGNGVYSARSGTPRSDSELDLHGHFVLSTSLLGFLWM